MRLLSLAVLSLSLTAAAPARAPKAAPIAVECVERDVLPFPLPSDDASAEWGDDDYERWERSAWLTYCAAGNRTDCECKR